MSRVSEARTVWRDKTFYEELLGIDDGSKSEGPWVTLSRIRSDVELVFSRDFVIHLAPEIRLTTSHDLLPDKPIFQRREYLDLRHTFRDERNSRGEVFLDRLYFGWQITDSARVTIGKQRVAWGRGFVFSPLDIFNPLPPQEIFTPERRGVDAFRLQYRLGWIMAEGVYAYLDENRRAGSVRGVFIVNTFDTAITVGRLDGADFLGVETSGSLGTWGIRAEYLSREGQTSYLASIDHRIGEQNLIELEYYRNGYGAADPARYASLILPLLRGEIPALARKYIALSGRKQLNPLEALEVTGTFNAIDEGLYINPRYIKSLSDFSEIVVGAQLFWGSPPAEYSSFSNFYYVRTTSYFGD